MGFWLMLLVYAALLVVGEMLDARVRKDASRAALLGEHGPELFMLDDGPPVLASSAERVACVPCAYCGSHERTPRGRCGNCGASS